MSKVIAVCTSEKKGIQKQAVPSIHLVEDWGIEGDAHAGKWHRQVSLLSHQKIEDFRARGAEVVDGAFGENIIVDGIDFATLPIGTKFYCNDVVLQLTQIGKECHQGCAIFQKMGECIMPKQGVFTRVLHGGDIKAGDEFRMELPFRVAVITVSDSGAAGKRADLSGPTIREIVEKAGYPVSHTALLPDERDQIAAELARIADEDVADLVLTTGGTGFSPRDWTPEATKDVTERDVPGIPEAMRALSMQITPRAMLSRAAAGIRKGTLIVNLPGSPKAVRECLEYILPALSHGLAILKGTANNCAR
ncbi:MOSC domain-containing protein [Pseudoflavonifractor sp. MSJ-37]|uniref:MOSC domain-containing protein n=1 Tax=Pseudoflavonifractor sp. MSJ-37 TaxID=2841531 RepID=UPI001C11C0B3|nr:MOSC domain-containing protein [Pseudoflavonifractor sp. MSJ-37]MBU5434033.1 MOSC domain-containing protein [Pseudoflavonifractor sp. MSJ-37]